MSSMIICNENESLILVLRLELVLYIRHELHEVASLCRIVNLKVGIALQGGRDSSK